jgi:quercetin dioxygenase-like cupin family protein
MSSPPRVAVLDADESCPRLPLVAGAGEAYAVVWPGVGATLRSMHRISLKPGSATIRMRHPMEAVYYVMSGGGTMRDPDTGTAEPVREGSMIHVEPGTAYIAEADAAGLELIGGPCPADPAFYRGLAAKADR